MKFLVFIFLLSTVLLGGASSPLAQERIVLKADPWCPYNCDPNSEKPGYMVEIARAVFEPLGYEVVYEVQNWARSLLEASRGKIDGVIGASVDDFPVGVFPENTLGVANNVLFVINNNPWRYEGPRSLDGVEVALINSYDYGEIGEIVKDNGDPHYVSGEYALELSIKQLQRGYVDALLDDVNVVNYKLKDMGLESEVVQASGKSGEAELPLYISFSPEKESSVEYARILSEGVQELRSSGELSKILARYGLKDWHRAVVEDIKKASE